MNTHTTNSSDGQLPVLTIMLVGLGLALWVLWPILQSLVLNGVTRALV